MSKLSAYAAALVSIGVSVVSCGGGGNSTVPPPPNPLYVRASASDTNSGADPANALRSVSKAVQIAGGNYRIIVGPGTYGGGITTASKGKAPQGLQIIADPSGVQTQDQAHAGPVLIDATGLGVGFQFNNSAGSVIDGFTITGATDAGIVLKTGSDDFTIQNCIVHDNAGDGIRVQDSASVLVFNNLVYSNGGKGIGVVGNGAGSPDAHVYSNTVYGNYDHGIAVGTANAASPQACVCSNIIEDNDALTPSENIKVFTDPRSDLGFNDPLTCGCSCNLVFPATYNPSSIHGLNDVNSSALFVNPPSDLHLRPTSPAIDRANPNTCALKLLSSQNSMLRHRTTTGSGLDTGWLDLGFHFLPQ